MSDEERALSGVRVLLVEHDAQCAKLMSVLLAAAGADVRYVTDHAAALASASVFRPQLVVLDMGLEAPGWEALVRALRSDAGTQSAVMVAVSAVDGAATVRAALDAGCAAYVRQPIDVDSFAQIIAQHLKGKS